MKNTAVLIVSFGTTDITAFNAAIYPIETKIKNMYSKIYHAFTSRFIIKLLKEKNIYIPSLEQALDKLFEDGFTEVICLALHIIRGTDYNHLVTEISSHPQSAHIRLSAPLLDDDFDTANLKNALVPLAADEHCEYIFIGHGTDNIASNMYKKLDSAFKKDNISNVHIASLKGELSSDNILKKIKSNNVVLHPLTLYAGIHTSRDIESSDTNSWKRKFETKGFCVSCVHKGLGEYDKIQDLYIDKLKAARHINTFRNTPTEKK